MTISFIMPCYNAEETVERAINSFLKQNHQNMIELLIINDGSTDMTREIIHKFSGYKNIWIFDKNNTGVSDSRNVGIKHAKGKYIAFLDADDILFPNYVDTVFQQLNISPVDIIFFGYEKRSQKLGSYNRVIPNKRLYMRNEFSLLLKTSIEGQYFGYAWSKIILTDLLKEHDIKFDINLSLAEDAILTLECIKYANKIVTLDSCLYVYVNNSDDSLSHKIRSNLFEEKSYYYKRFKYELLKISPEAMELIYREAFYSILDCMIQLPYMHNNNKYKLIKKWMKSELWKEYKFLNMNAEMLNLSPFEKISSYIISINWPIIIYLYFRIIVVVKDLKNTAKEKICKRL